MQAMNSVDRLIRFTLNGRPVKAIVSPQDNLVDLLRRLDHFGARESCGQGMCGCCSVIVDKVAVSGCLTLAFLADGADVSTIEGLDAGGALSRCRKLSSKKARSSAASARPVSS
jgi:carbon-monoxide dehydrogenase small subunit